MPRRNRVTPLVLLVIALVALGRFSQGVRAVDVVGLFASGMLTGVVIMRLIALRKVL